MTDEEAIKQLKKCKSFHNGSYGTAIDIAIKALEQQAKTETHGSTYGGVSWGGTYKPQQTCEDCISREAVIKHLENITMDTNPDHYDSKDKWYQANGFNMCKVGIEIYVVDLPSVTPKARWIPVSERLPKENEYIGNVCKYYLIQDEYGDMHVAHLSNVGWIPMHSLKAIGDEVIAWMPLPEPYKAESEE